MSKQLITFFDSLILAEKLNGSFNEVGNRTVIHHAEQFYYLNNWHTYEHSKREKIFSIVFDIQTNELSFIIVISSSEQSKKTMSAFKKFLNRKSQGKIMIDLISNPVKRYKLRLKGNTDSLKEFIACRVEYVGEFFEKGDQF